MYQAEYFCEDCQEKHFGNCPKIKVTLTTSKPTDSQDKLDELLNNQDNYELVEYDNGEVLKAQGIVGVMTSNLKPEAKQTLRTLILNENTRARIDELRGLKVKQVNSPNAKFEIVSEHWTGYKLATEDLNHTIDQRISELSQSIEDKDV